MDKILERLKYLKELLSTLTDNFSTLGIITAVIDVLILLAIFFLLLKAIKAKFNIGKIVLFVLVYSLLLLVTYIFNLNIVFYILKFVIPFAIIAIVILYKEEFRHSIDKGFHITSSSTSSTSIEEKNQIIETLVNTAIYLSDRKTGALITIEGQESLDSYINKAIVIKSVITQELLTTLFYVGTATHDGAVIIRNNRIMCAGVILPTTDRYDIPKSLGTRHRAAIGISEKCDALTIIVSEETGKISVTRNGGIEVGITPEYLKTKLEEHYSVK